MAGMEALGILPQLQFINQFSGLPSPLRQRTIRGALPRPKPSTSTMKHSLTAAAISAILSALVALGQSTEAPTAGLIAHHRFDGDANSAVTNQFSVSPTAIGFSTNRFGFSSAAGAFDGDSSRLLFAPATNCNLLPVTVSAWVNLGANPGTDIALVSNYLNASANGWGLFLNGDSVRAWYYGTQGSVPAGFLSVPLTEKKWHHLTAAFDSTGGRLFANGRLVATHGWSGTVSKSTSQQGLLVGATRYPNGSHQTYRGQMDDLRIYSRALTDGEVLSLYQFEASAYRRARAVAQVVNGSVVGLEVSDGGQGFQSAPEVDITGTGTGAKVVATVAFGRVVGFQVVSAGTGYFGQPAVRIAAPPWVPVLNLAVQTVRLTLGVVEGTRYQLESSIDLSVWIPQGEFVATSDTETRDFNAAESGQYFRIREVP